MTAPVPASKWNLSIWWHLLPLIPAGGGPCPVPPRLTRLGPLFVALVMPAAEVSDFGRDYFDRSTFVAVLVVIFTDLETALYIDGIAAAQIFGARGPHAVESDYPY